MKLQYLLVGFLCVSVPACMAQIHVQTGDGEDVTIGPSGINVTGRGKHVQINSNGTINVQKPYKSTTISAPRTSVRTTSVKKAARGKSTVTTTTTTTTTTSTMPLATQVTIIEKQVTGQTFEGMPLNARVEKLEQDNLGKKGSGALNVRVTLLARELGVKLTGSPPVATNINSSNTTRTVITEGRGMPGTSTSTIVTTEGNGGGSTMVDIGGILGGINGALAGVANGIAVSGSNQNQSITTNGQVVSVSGSSSAIRVVGQCPALHVSGSSNTVWVDNVDNISVSGSSNRIFWNRGVSLQQPNVSNTGSNNQIIQGFNPQ